MKREELEELERLLREYTEEYETEGSQIWKDCISTIAAVEEAKITYIYIKRK